MSTDEALVAEHGPFLAAHAFPQVGPAAEDAPLEPDPRAQVGVVVHHRPLEDHVVADPEVAADRAVLAESRPGADHAVVPHHRRTIEVDARVDLRTLADPHSRSQLEPFDVDVHPLAEDVLVGLQVGLESAHVLPVALGDVAEQALPRGERGGERIAREVDRTSFGDEVEDLRLEHVDPCVDGVAEDLAPGGLFEEPFDRAVGPGDDDPELERVVDGFQGEGGEAAPIGVERHQGGEVQVGEDVPGDDQKALVEFVACVQHRAGRPERRRLGRVDHAHPELRPVAEVGPDRVGHEGHRHHHVLEPVLTEEVDHVLHHRDVGHREHRFRLVGGERTKSSPLASRHDDRFHRLASSFRAPRPAASTWRAAGRYENAAIQARVRPPMPANHANARKGTCQLAEP